MWDRRCERWPPAGTPAPFLAAPLLLLGDRWESRRKMAHTTRYGRPDGDPDGPVLPVASRLESDPVMQEFSISPSFVSPSLPVLFSVFQVNITYINL